MKAILWFDQIDRRALNQAGGKGANLGEMARAGLPVPTGRYGRIQLGHVIGR